MWRAIKTGHQQAQGGTEKDAASDSKETWSNDTIRAVRYSIVRVARSMWSEALREVTKMECLGTLQCTLLSCPANIIHS